MPADPRDGLEARAESHAPERAEAAHRRDADLGGPALLGERTILGERRILLVAIRTRAGDELRCGLVGVDGDVRRGDLAGAEGCEQEGQWSAPVRCRPYASPVRAVSAAGAARCILSFPSMARIVIGCWGSHGDFDPSVGLGLGLQRRGHDVTVATIAYFEPHLRAAGLKFHAIRPDVRPDDASLIQRIMDRDHGTEVLLREIVYPALPAMLEDFTPLVGTTDLFVSHPLTMVIPMLAEKHGIPWASTVLAPMSFFSPTDIPVLPPAPWLKALDGLGRWPGRVLAAAADVATRGWAAPAYALRESMRLPRGGNPLFDAQHSPHLVLALYSKVLGAPQPSWPANVVITGHMFHDATHGATLAPEVEDFLARGPPPVVFTLGSSAILAPGTFWRESLAAVRALGVRAICMVGPGNAEALRAELPSHAMALEMAPHSLLMPRASVVVQQCGIGTLAQGLRSGAPMLAVPFAHDQPDNAYRATKLGLARILPPSRYRAPRVAEELERLVRDPSYRAAAQRVASEVRAERGVDVACDALEARFGL